MKKLRLMFVMILTLTMVFAASVFVSADTTTDLKSMKVYAVDAAGNKTEVPMNFNSTTYTYDLTVLSTTESIAIEAEPADSTSTWVIEKDGINTKMDFGKNFTAVAVTSSTGAVNKYTLNTTRLTADEEATYDAPEVNSDGGDTDKKDTDKTVTVGKQEMKITSSFDEKLIPEGFEQATVEYDGEEYTCIKGEVKDLTAFYLYNDETEGFYIYDADNNEFYAMNNIKIKSRMYTIVNPSETEKMLKNYDKKTVTIIDQEVKAWVLDEDEGMYLVYAMNWNGDTNLYCYDDNEKCFQRYLLSSDENAQVDAAKTAYENIQKKYNNLVDRYNILLKVACGLVIVIIILIFVIINMALNKKEKRIKSGKKNKGEGKIETDEAEVKTEAEELSADDEDVQVSIVVNDDDIISDRTYGDEPTFGTDKEQKEGFYGGEIEDEDEIFIDITDDEDNEIPEELKVVTQEEIDNNTEKAQKEAEEDLKETLKSMLPDEQDDDDDDDFEFIVLDE